MKSTSLKFAAVALSVIAWGPAVSADKGSLPRVEMPAGVTTHETDYGAVFADAQGMTLYRAVNRNLGGGDCRGYATGAAMNSGAQHPDLNQHFKGDATCADKYPYLEASDDAKPVGKWTIITRKDGKKQWSFDGRPLFRSVKDTQPGDVNADLYEVNYSMAEPAYVPFPLVPNVRVVRNGLGQYLGKVIAGGYVTLYTYDADRRGKSACEGECTETWKPLLAGALTVQDVPGWSLVTRKDGTKQWAYKDKPLYTNINDSVSGHRNGEAVSGWQMAFVGSTVAPPAEIQVRNTWLSEAYAQAKDGRTVYVFSCRLGVTCDDPKDRDAYWRYWYSFCGEAADCAKMFQPVLAPKDAKDRGRTWTVVKMKAPWSPVRQADGVTDESINVWAYKGRPMFTYVGDDKPGKFNAIGFERGTGSFRWTAFGPLGVMDTLTQL